MFTHHRIHNALTQAHRRGLLVELIMDKQNSPIKGSARPALHWAGSPVYIPPEDLTMHSKVILIDDVIVITGSFSLTWPADLAIVENLIILRDKPNIVRAFLKHHRSFRKISNKYSTAKAK